MRYSKRFNRYARCRQFATLGFVFAIGLLSIIHTPSSQSIEFQVGYAESDITPDLGVFMPGYFSERRATGVLDPIRAKAVALTHGETTLTIIAVDVINFPREHAHTIQEEIADRTGLSPESIFLNATHTHTGPAVSEIMDELPSQIAETVLAALQNRVSTQDAALGSARVHDIAFIRRFLMRDGSIRTNPGRNNPEVVRPVGEIDPNLYALVFDDAKTVVVSFGLHLDCVGGTQYSADYPYHLTERVRESLGDDWNVLFLNACSGNVNHIDVNNPDQRSSYEESRRIGRVIGEAALEATRNASPIEIDALAYGRITIESPIRDVPPDLLGWARDEMERDVEAATQRRFNEETPARLIALAERAGQSDLAEIIAMRIGPIGLVGMPAEIFVEIGRDIQAKSLLEPTWVIGLVGGSMGYVPHPRGYDEGGYEATFGSARYAPETPILWSDAAIRMLNAMANNARDF